MPYRYLRDPGEILRQSYALIRAEVDLTPIAPELHELALRLVHSSGQPALLAALDFRPGVATAARSALAAGAPVLCDTEMVARGVQRARLPASNAILCRLGDHRAAARATRGGITRSAAAVELWGPDLAGAVVAIGNAPTALFRLLELLGAGAPVPAAILAFPVGFVGAAEAKRALADAPLEIPYVTLHGRVGGSGLAAAAVNALARDTP